MKDNMWEERLKDNYFQNWLINMLHDIKSEIVSEVKQIIREKEKPAIKKWVKSADVKKLLNVSHGKLQTMRNNKTISFTRIGGTLYYNVEDIQRMMEEHSE